MSDGRASRVNKIRTHCVPGPIRIGGLGRVDVQRGRVPGRVRGGEDARQKHPEDAMRGHGPFPLLDVQYVALPICKPETLWEASLSQNGA
eukprot:11181502-Heterocapsa_arctica.AAC.1